MQLDTFIKETLVRIQKGVKEANVFIANSEGTKVRTNGEMQFVIDQNRSGKNDGGVTFDVAVTVISEKSAEGEGKINVVGVTLGGGKTAITTEQNVSRIKFKVDPFNSIY